MTGHARLLSWVVASLFVALGLATLSGCKPNDAGTTQTDQRDSGAELVRRTPPPPNPELEWQLFSAIDLDDEARAMELIEQGAPIMAMSDPRGVTVLHRAAQMSMPNLTRLLLEYGADINIRIDGVHHQPIHWAARAGGSDRPGRAPGAAEATIDVLLEYGADINAATEHGVRPIDYAIQLGNESWKRFLISRGAQE